MFKVGQKVKVTDQRPPAEGEIVEVSTWRKVFKGNYGSDDTCYRIKSSDWMNSERWIGAVFVELV